MAASNSYVQDEREFCEFIVWADKHASNDDDFFGRIIGYLKLKRAYASFFNGFPGGNGGLGDVEKRPTLRDEITEWGERKYVVSVDTVNLICDFAKKLMGLKVPFSYDVTINGVAYQAYMDKGNPLMLNGKVFDPNTKSQYYDEMTKDLYEHIHAEGIIV